MILHNSVLRLYGKSACNITSHEVIDDFSEWFCKLGDILNAVDAGAGFDFPVVKRSDIFVLAQKVKSANGPVPVIIELYCKVALCFAPGYPLRIYPVRNDFSNNVKCLKFLFRKFHIIIISDSRS